jgi:hypothetical protein
MNELDEIKIVGTKQAAAYNVRPKCKVTPPLGARRFDRQQRKHSCAAACMSLIRAGYVMISWSKHVLTGKKWLRHYATSQKIAGSIPDKDIAFFLNVLNSSRRIMTLRLT